MVSSGPFYTGYFFLVIMEFYLARSDFLHGVGIWGFGDWGVTRFIQSYKEAENNDRIIKFIIY